MKYAHIGNNLKGIWVEEVKNRDNSIFRDQKVSQNQFFNHPISMYN